MDTPLFASKAEVQKYFDIGKTTRCKHRNLDPMFPQPVPVFGQEKFVAREVIEFGEWLIKHARGEAAEPPSYAISRVGAAHGDKDGGHEI